MKKSSATIYSPAMELPVISNKRTIRRNRRRSGKEAEPVNHIVQPPSEELIAELNRIGQEYPFCVCFKAKAHDTL